MRCCVTFTVSISTRARALSATSLLFMLSWVVVGFYQHPSTGAERNQINKS